MLGAATSLVCCDNYICCIFIHTTQEQEIKLQVNKSKKKNVKHGMLLAARHGKQTKEYTKIINPALLDTKTLAYA